MRFILALLAALISLQSVAQSPYELNWKTETGLLGGTTLLLGANLWRAQNLSPYTQQELDALDKSKVNGMDRFATGLWSPAARLRSDLLVVGSMGLSGIGVLAYPVLNDKEAFGGQFLTLSAMLLEANLLTYALSDFVKMMVLRPRPYMYNPEVGMHHKLELDGRKSFFSSHASLSATNTFFAAKVFSDYYPDSKWKPLVWTAAILIPAWTGTERVLAGKHFPTDVMVGYLVGAACGYLVPHFHKKKVDHENAFSFHPVNGINYQGLSFSLRF